MVVVAQLVRAPDCGSGGRRFETDLPPKNTRDNFKLSLFLLCIFSKLPYFSHKLISPFILKTFIYTIIKKCFDF